jgi:hypothetical protein
MTMKKRHERWLEAAVMSTLLAVTSPVLAEVVKGDAPDPPASEARNAGAVDLNKHAYKSWTRARQLRCWQEGRLIFEENDWHEGHAIGRPVDL